jgi:anti-sigma regulatory factor (Ser/Thr protein kinase)
VIVAFTIPSDTCALAGARRAVSRQIEHWGVLVDVGAVRLLVSELLANAILHGRPPIELSVALRPGAVRVTVADGSTDPLAPAGPSATGDSGRGLLLLDRLADRWGTESLPEGKLVWFEVDDA